MINIYTQGSKTLGLGHLSRIVPLYHYLKQKGIGVKTYLHGDEFGVAYLFINGVEAILASDILSKSHIELSNNWIIDCTKIWEKPFQEVLSETTNLLLSPKFESDQIEFIDFAILRSDPFQLPIKNKAVSAQHFFFNNGMHFKKNEGVTIAIALSGSKQSTHIADVLNTLVNTKQFEGKIAKIYIFTGGSGGVNYEKNLPYSYLIEVITIDSLLSLWSYIEDVNIMIVGNGIIVDECLILGKDFLIYDTIGNAIVKSINADKAQENYTQDLATLEHKLLQKIEQKLVNTEDLESTNTVSDESTFDLILSFFNGNAKQFTNS